MEIIDNLDRLRMTHSRLLYLIQEMHFMKRITIEEKLILKCIVTSHFNNVNIEMVFREEKELMSIVEDFNVQ